MTDSRLSLSIRQCVWNVAPCILTEKD